MIFGRGERVGGEELESVLVRLLERCVDGFSRQMTGGGCFNWIGQYSTCPRGVAITCVAELDGGGLIRGRERKWMRVEKKLLR